MDLWSEQVSSGYAGVIGVVAAHLGGFSALGTLSPLTASAQDSINLQRLLNQHLGICIVCCQKWGLDQGEEMVLHQRSLRG